MKTLFYLCLQSALLVFCLSSCTAVQELKVERQNEAIIQNWLIEGWNNNRWEELVPQVFSENWEDGNPIRPDQTTGVNGMLDMIRFYRKAFEDPKFNITHIVGDEEFVVARYEITARHIGTYLGIPPSGNLVTTTGMAIFEMENGKVKTTWAELDLTSILNQIRE